MLLLLVLLLLLLLPLLLVLLGTGCCAAGKYSVPVLWDKKEGVIVNNESSDILRMFNSSFNNLAKNPGLDLYPEPLRSKIDEVGVTCVNCVMPLLCDWPHHA